MFNRVVDDYAKMVQFFSDIGYPTHQLDEIVCDCINSYLKAFEILVKKITKDVDRWTKIQYERLHISDDVSNHVKLHGLLDTANKFLSDFNLKDNRSSNHLNDIEQIILQLSEAYAVSANSTFHLYKAHMFFYRRINLASSEYKERLSALEEEVRASQEKRTPVFRTAFAKLKALLFPSNKLKTYQYGEVDKQQLLKNIDTINALTVKLYALLSEVKSIKELMEPTS